MGPSILLILFLFTAACLPRLSTALTAAANTTNNLSDVNAARTICAGPWDTTHLNNGPVLMQRSDCIAAFLLDFTQTYTVYQSQGVVYFYEGEEGQASSKAGPLVSAGVGNDEATFQLPWKVRHGSCTIITTMRHTIPLIINGQFMRTMIPGPRGPASMQDVDQDPFAELYDGVTVLLGACVMEVALPRAGFAIAGVDHRIGILLVGTGSSADAGIGDVERGGGAGGESVAVD